MSKSSIREEVLNLARTVSVDILEEKQSLHDILLTCKTLCKKLGISDKNEWIDLELNGYLGKYKTREELFNNIPSYRRTSWIFYDIYGKKVPLPDDIIELFGKSAIPHSISEIESNEYLTISSPLLDKFNEFIAEHGTDYASKNLRIHVAHIPSNEIQKVIDGVKKRIHEFLDNLILILEHN